jgi:hypothetical protein
MIEQIKTIVENYINNRKLACLMIGTATDDGVKISEKLTLPWELISGTLKDFAVSGDTLQLIRDDGGQRFYIVEIIGYAPAAKGRTVQIEPITIGDVTISEIKIKDVTAT